MRDRLFTVRYILNHRFPPTLARAKPGPLGLVPTLEGTLRFGNYVFGVGYRKGRVSRPGPRCSDCG